MLNEIIPINTKEKEFDMLMNIYQKACNQVYEMVNGLSLSIIIFLIEIL